MIKPAADLRLNLDRFGAEQHAVQVGDMHRVVNDRPAARERAVNEPAAGHAAPVRAPNRQDVPDGPGPHARPEPLERGRVAAGEGGRQADAAFRAERDHRPRVFQGGRQRLLAEDGLHTRRHGRLDERAVVDVLRGDDHAVKLLAQQSRVRLEKGRPEARRHLLAPRRVRVGDADECDLGVRGQCRRIGSGVHVGEREDADFECHASMTALPVSMDSSAASAIRAASRAS